MNNSEKEYAYWLSNVPGIGNVSAIGLINSGMSCKEIYTAGAKELSGVLTAKQIKNLEKSRYSWNFDEEEKKLLSMGIRFISMNDPEYPEKLKDIPDPPFGIYVKGKLPDPLVPSVSIVGARMCSDYGRYMAREFGRGLAISGVQVISGMARGVDGIAQHAALEAGGASFGILGCGVDICYPEENRDVYEALLKGGGVISEFPPGTVPKPNFFPMRNRIISALSDALLVVEARQKSGTTITVDTALEQGRDVLAVPGRVTDRLSDGCNYLISQGAGVAIGVEDVLDRLWKLRMKPSKEEAEKEDAAEEKDSFGDDVVERENAEYEDYMQELSEPLEKEKSLEEEILGILDIIPVSTSYILEELTRKGRDTTVPLLMTTLMGLVGSGQIAQNGAYYHRTGTLKWQSI